MRKPGKKIQFNFIASFRNFSHFLNFMVLINYSLINDFQFFFIPLAAETIIDFLVLASEIGGAAYALQLLTGVSYRLWAIPVALLIWGLLWRATFGAIEHSVAVLGPSRSRSSWRPGSCTRTGRRSAPDSFRTDPRR